MQRPKDITQTELTDLKQLLHIKVERILDLFSWPSDTRPPITVKYIYDVRYQGGIAYTQFLVDTRISSLNIIELVPHSYTITLNYLELLQYTPAMQDFIIAHEVAHIVQVEQQVPELLLVKFLSLPYSATLGFMLGIAWYMGAPYAFNLFIAWLVIALICNALARSYEVKCDRQAACALGTAQGGIDFMYAYEDKHKLLLSQWNNFFVYYFFASHPMPEYRALKLKNYQC
jgi:hypothetical protein